MKQARTVRDREQAKAGAAAAVQVREAGEVIDRVQARQVSAYAPAAALPSTTSRERPVLRLPARSAAQG